MESSLKNKICLVTGASGFIGYHLTKRLLEEGARVRVLVRKTSNIQFLSPLAVEKYVGDVSDVSSLQRAIGGVEYLFHVAGVVNFNLKDVAELRRVNVQGVRNVLGVAQDLKTKRVVLTSSVAAIGGSKNKAPQNEESPWDEEVPHNAYSVSKHDGEMEAMKLYREGLPLVVVNPSSVIGAPDPGPSMGGRFIQSYLEGKFKASISTGLNLVDVKDVAEGHLLAAVKGRVGERYILCNRNIMLKDSLKLLEKVSGIRAPKILIPDWMVYWGAALVEGLDRTFLKKGLPMNRLQACALRFPSFYSHEKATRELGYHPRPLEETLEKTVRWFQEHYKSPTLSL